MEFTIGDEVQLEMKVGDDLLLGGTYKCTNKYHIFTKEDLKPGLVIQYKNGKYAMILPTIRGLIAIDEDSTYTELASLTYDLKISNAREDEYDVTKVYGFSKYCFNAHKIGIDHRELLWEREKDEEKINEKVNKGEIIIRGNKFTDINKAINYLKKMKTLKQFKKQFNNPKYMIGDRFFFENLHGVKNTIGLVISSHTNRDMDYPEYEIIIGEKNYHNAEAIPLNEQELESLGKKINY